MARTSGGTVEGAGIVERGNIYFLYRPKVRDPEEERSVEGIGDVERFYMVLRSEQGSRLVRLMVIGRKRLPDIGDHERNWGFVEKIARSAKELEEELERGSYETKTRGERIRPAVRPAGEGIYALVQKGRNLHLAYVLELPDDPGPVQKQLKIAPEGSFVISVKNPEKGSPPNVGLRPSQEAEYPKELQKEFRDHRFATEDPRLLDYEGAEFVLIGAEPGVKRDLGVRMVGEDESEGTADIMKELRLSKSKHPVEPLLTGDWR